MKGKFTVIIPAAGEGKRLGQDISKAFVDLEGTPMVLRTLKQFSGFDEVCQCIVAVREQDLETARQILPDCLVVKGGDSRQESVLAALERAEGNFVAIHDAARPFASRNLIQKVFSKTLESGAAIAAVPVTDTIKSLENRMIKETVDRSVLWRAQTPQAFRTELLRKAFLKAAETGLEATDDAQVVENLPHTVHIVEGDESNLKITTPEDLVRARRIISETPYQS